MKRLLLLTLLATPAFALEKCPGGTASTLELDVEIPRIPTLQGGLGRTTMTQRFADPIKKPIERSWPGISRCLTFDPDTQEFVLLHRDVMGSVPAYAGVTLVADASGELRGLQFDDLGHVVLAGPDGRYAVAVIGRGQLMALDFTKLTATRLGMAPAPMPLTAEEAQWYKSRKPLTWDREPRDGTSELEPEILRFTGPTQVTVSYGKDSAKARAGKRTVQVLDVTKPVEMVDLRK